MVKAIRSVITKCYIWFAPLRRLLKSTESPTAGKHPKTIRASKQHQGHQRMKPKVEKPEMTQLLDLGEDKLDAFIDVDDTALNLAIMASLQSSNQQNFIDLYEDYHFFYDFKDFTPEPQATRFSKQKQPFGDSAAERGQSSSSKDDRVFVCEICVDTKAKSELFFIKGCTHFYCKDCMVNYIASKLQENISNISCPEPGCKGSLEPGNCRSILPRDVFDRWGSALCEAMILGSQKFYCPFKDCSAMMVDEGGEVIKESECPNCRRLFCAQCKVPWHAEIECEQFKRLHKDEREKEDRMLMKLAENKRWKRCPSCRIFVERIDGCKYMRCRCKTAFCYSCGTTKVDTSSHYCHVCKAAWD